MNLLRPMLAKSVAKPFDDPAWFFEIKWDGYRAMAYLDGQTRLYSRNLKPLIYPQLADLHTLIQQPVILDGEIVSDSFDSLARKEGQTIFVVFDILSISGHLLLQETFVRRQQILKSLIQETEVLRRSVGLVEQGKQLYSQAKSQGLEGIVAKKLSSIYQPGVRSAAWLKILAEEEKEVSIIRLHYKQGRAVAAEVVGSDFASKVLLGAELDKQMLNRFAPIKADERILNPVWLGVVRYREVTTEGRLRHGVLKEIKSDGSLH